MTIINIKHDLISWLKNWSKDTQYLIMNQKTYTILQDLKIIDKNEVILANNIIMKCAINNSLELGQIEII